MDAFSRELTLNSRVFSAFFSFFHLRRFWLRPATGARVRHAAPVPTRQTPNRNIGVTGDVMPGRFSRRQGAKGHERRQKTQNRAMLFKSQRMVAEKQSPENPFRRAKYLILNIN
jgi:hypothetical protein